MTFFKWVKQKYPGWKYIGDQEMLRMNDAWDAAMGIAKKPHPDCYYFDGPGCQNINIDKLEEIQKEIRKGK